MKRLLFFICAAFIAIATPAQTSLLATLCHDGQITTFYSSKALLNAHNAAQDGDVITLSGGMFEGITVNKNVTIRGAGMAGINPTIISGTLTVRPATQDGSITFEGLYINQNMTTGQAHNLRLVKCKINNLNNLNAYPSNNISIIQCDIFGGYTMYGSGAVISNSYVALTSAGGTKYTTFENSIIKCTLGQTGINSNYTNCIFFDQSTSQGSTVNGTNVCQGCYYVGPATNPYKEIVNDTNKVFPASTNFLKEGTTTYELLDELQTTWLGTDGTQVGMHGGSLPFDPETTIPKIKKFEVSSKTSADGKLSVNLEIDAD